MELETQEVVSLTPHKYAEVVRPAGTRYHAEKRFVPVLVQAQLAKLAPAVEAPVSIKKNKRSRK
jgi:hypothetical protein